MRHRFTAPGPDRLVRVVRSALGASRAAAEALVRGGAVLVDGQVRSRPEQLVTPGAVIEVRTASAPVASPLVERYRDRWLVAVDKPAGLPTQAGREGGDAHVVGLLSAVDPYVALHHRLDQPASGLVLLAVDPAANAGLARAFQRHEVRRSYLAVVLGDPGESGRWTAPVEGQPAATRWTRLAQGEGMSVLALELETGRCHQIRVHAAGVGAPIVGDRRHGGAVGRAWPRLALHAASLALTHPVTGRTVAIRSPVPDDLLPLIVRAGWRAMDDAGTADRDPRPDQPAPSPESEG